MILPAVTRRSRFWFAAFVVWFVVLWFLSSSPPPSPPGPKIPQIDKVLHFGYYFGGAGILSAALFLLRRDPRLGWDVIHLLTLFLLTTTGAIDEWHQSWYPFRSGNDAIDLAADFFGAFTGTLLFRRFSHLLQEPPPPGGRPLREPRPPPPAGKNKYGGSAKKSCQPFPDHSKRPPWIVSA